MDIQTIVMGDYEANCYALRKDLLSSECLLIDPGLNPEPLVQLLQQQDLNPVSILLTHGHADHIGGVEAIREHWPDVQVTIHADDAVMLTDPSRNLSVMAGSMVQARPAEHLLDSERKFFQAAGLRFKVLHTPGHSPGSICLYSAQHHVLFSGDTLFAGSVGRTDFPGGSYEQMIEMIQAKLLTLPDKTSVYPGHGPATTLANEKKYNPFLLNNQPKGTSGL